VGIERFWFGGKTFSLICEKPDWDQKRSIKVTSEDIVDLTARAAERVEHVKVPAGKPVKFAV